jgi:hypothetical protein
MRDETGTTDPHSSPWPVPAVEGIPVDDDSEEARAIERVLDRAERERSTIAAALED